MENTVLEKFHQGRQSLGTFSAIGSPLAVESLRYTGLDYVIVDTEHSPAGIESAAAQIAAAQGAGLTALARANEISRTAVLRLLDVGAQGVVVPCVETVEEVRELVRYAKFAPLGNRGFCPHPDCRSCRGRRSRPGQALRGTEYDRGPTWRGSRRCRWGWCPAPSDTGPGWRRGCGTPRSPAW